MKRHLRNVALWLAAVPTIVVIAVEVWRGRQG